MSYKDIIDKQHLGTELPEEKHADVITDYSDADDEIYTDGVGQNWDTVSNKRIAREERRIAVARKNAELRQKSKQNFSKDILKCVIVLTAIAIFSGALLGTLNWLTWVDPDQKIFKSIAEYYGVTENDISKVQDMVINPSDSKNTVKAVYAAGAGAELKGYTYYTSGSGGKGGSIELLVFIGSDGKIKEIAAYAQKETAGYFSKVEKQIKPKYIGVAVSSLERFELIEANGKPENNSQINAVTRATLTTKGYNNAVNAAVYAYNQFMGRAAQ